MQRETQCSIIWVMILNSEWTLPHNLFFYYKRAARRSLDIRSCWVRKFSLKVMLNGYIYRLWNCRRQQQQQEASDANFFYSARVCRASVSMKRDRILVVVNFVRCYSRNWWFAFWWPYMAQASPINKCASKASKASKALDVETRKFFTKMIWR